MKKRTRRLREEKRPPQHPNQRIELTVEQGPIEIVDGPGPLGKIMKIPRAKFKAELVNEPLPFCEVTYFVKGRVIAVIPERIQALPLAQNGYPALFTLGRKWIKGYGVFYDFNAIAGERVLEAMGRKLCGICGQALTVDKMPMLYTQPFVYFIGGPLSANTGCFNDPPMHEECAKFAMRVCPWMVMGQYRRSPDRPTFVKLPGQVEVNQPLAFALVRARRYDSDANDMLFYARDYEVVQWWKPGGLAVSPEEVAHLNAAARAELMKMDVNAVASEFEYQGQRIQKAILSALKQKKDQTRLLEKEQASGESTDEQ